MYIQSTVYVYLHDCLYKFMLHFAYLSRKIIMEERVDCHILILIYGLLLKMFREFNRDFKWFSAIAEQ